jgi:hypothetical protein
MKIARRMISGIGMPISQSRTPRPKPIVASCSVGRQRDAGTVVPAQEPNNFFGHMERFRPIPRDPRRNAIHESHVRDVCMSAFRI